MYIPNHAQNLQVNRVGELVVAELLNETLDLATLVVVVVLVGGERLLLTVAGGERRRRRKRRRLRLGTV